MKKRLLCPLLPIPSRPAFLSEEEAHHAVRVLRLQDGDSVEVLDGKGARAIGILRTRGGRPRIEYTETEQQTFPITSMSPTMPLTLEVAVLKGNAMEWVIEKAVELGIERLTPILTDHTVVQIKQKGAEFFQSRWQKIADQALKQCGRLSKLIIDPPVSLQTLLVESKRTSQSFTRIWCDEKSAQSDPYLLEWLRARFEEAPQTISKANSSRAIHCLIGPEGGWSHAERTLLEKESEMHPLCRVSLGSLILRAETAALFTMSLIGAYFTAETRQKEQSKINKN